MSHVSITASSATRDGGGVYVNCATSGEKITISDSSISGNTSGIAGGGLFVYGAKSITLVGSQFNSNSAANSYGGGVYAEVNTSSTGMVISACKFEQNDAANGGGLDLNNANAVATSKITINASVISSNTAKTGAGGGVQFGNGSIGGGFDFINGGSITLNKGVTGGGLYSNNFTALTISKANIRQNGSTGTAGHEYGGGVFLGGSAGAAKIVDTTIDLNTSAQNGGGLTLEGNIDLTLVASVVSGNTSAYNGGGIYSDGPSVAVVGGTFSHNTAADGPGGGMYLNSGPVSVTGAKVISNTSTFFGGGGMEIVDSSPVTLHGVTLDDNVTGPSDGGGGIVIDGCTDTLVTGCAIHGNHASYGGGMYFKDSTATVTATIISGNAALKKGGGVYIENGGSITLQVGHVTGNTAVITGANVYGLFTPFT